MARSKWCGMEIEKITVKVELGGVAVQAVAILTDREARTKEGAAGAAAALCAELQTALRDGVDAGVLVGANAANGGQESTEQRFYQNGVPRSTNPEPRWIPEHFCLEHEVEFTRQQNARGSWYSHQVDGGGWCKETR